MKSFKMKALAVAVLGLTGLGMAGSAFGQACPTDPAAPAGAWSSKAVTQGVLAITTPGLNGTNCKLQVALNQGSALFAKSAVTDTSPVDEPRYRARFYVDTSEITGLTSVLRSVKIFNASSTTSPAGASGEEVAVQLSGTLGAPTAVFTIADSTQPSGFNQFSILLPNAAGVNRIEFDLTQGASTTFRYWVTDGALVTTDTGAPPAGPNLVAGVNNTGWSGVTQAVMGEFAANNTWRTNYTALTHLYFDEFDSRRQTFIGK
jgi:hypothetical protein